MALFSDSGGSVFELRLRRSLVGRSAAARCIFSGSRGEVVTMEPLPAADHPTHPLQHQMVIALATMSKVRRWGAVVVGTVKCEVMWVVVGVEIELKECCSDAVDELRLCRSFCMR